MKRHRTNNNQDNIVVDTIYTVGATMMVFKEWNLECVDIILALMDTIDSGKPMSPELAIRLVEHTKMSKSMNSMLETAINVSKELHDKLTGVYGDSYL